MADLNDYFSRLMLRELDNFRAGPTNPAADTTAAAATEVADTASPPATGQADPTTPAEMADAPSPSPTAAPTTNEGEHTTKQPDTPPQPQGAAVPPAAGADSTSTTGCLQGTTHLRLLTIPNTTPRQRRNNGARQQRVYRLAAKFGVSPGAPRWVRNNRAYAQPAVPKSVVVDNANINNNKTVEYNQFMYDGSGDDRAVVLRMPGGWKRDLVRSRPQFLGVAVIDGFLWPRFSPNLARRVLVDWGKSIDLHAWRLRKLTLLACDRGAGLR